LAHKTNSTSPLFIEVPVPSQESERSSICVLEVSILNLLTSTDDIRKNPERTQLFTLVGKTVFRPLRVRTMADAVYFTSGTSRGSTSSSYIIANIILYIGNT
jgi:hypothetical protein